MGLLKKHVGKIILSTILAIIGVMCGVLPYFAVADIVTGIVSGYKGLVIFRKDLLIVFIGLTGAVVFHTVSTLISHNLAFGLIADLRKKLARKITGLPMGTVENKGSGEWSHFMVESISKIEQPIAHVIPEVLANVIIPIVLLIIIFTMDWRFVFTFNDERI